MSKEQELSITLSEEEAIVLYEFVSRFSENDKLTLVDHSEKVALWNLCCIFEKVLVAPFKPDYEEYLESCRHKLREK